MVKNENDLLDPHSEALCPPSPSHSAKLIRHGVAFHTSCLKTWLKKEKCTDLAIVVHILPVGQVKTGLQLKKRPIWENIRAGGNGRENSMSLSGLSYLRPYLYVNIFRSVFAISPDQQAENILPVGQFWFDQQAKDFLAVGQMKLRLQGKIRANARN